MNRIMLLAMAVCAVLAGCRNANIEKGNTCLSLGDYPMAIEFFDREVRARPDKYEARMGLGKAYLQKAVDDPYDTTSWKKALIHLEAARTLKPDEPAVRMLSQVWAEYSRRMLSVGDTISALEALSSALQYDPENVDIINRAGILYFRLGYGEKADILFHKAITIDSTNAHSYFNAGMLSWSQNDVTGARDYWYKALTIEPEDEDILYWFALSEKRSRQKE